MDFSWAVSLLSGDKFLWVKMSGQETLAHIAESESVGDLVGF